MHFKIDSTVEQASCPVPCLQQKWASSTVGHYSSYCCSIRRNYVWCWIAPPLVHATGLGLMSHISLAYWSMVRSLLNLPLPAVFKMDILIHFFLSLSCNQAFSLWYETIKGRGKRRISRLCPRYDHYMWGKKETETVTLLHLMVNSMNITQ